MPAIARLVAAAEDTVRDVIHAFNDKGLAALDPRWAGGRPRLITDDDIAFVVTTATTRPAKLGQPFTHWSLRKLAAYLADNPARVVGIGRERLRQILRERGITFQRTRTWKESTDPDKEAKLDRIEQVTTEHPDRCFRVRPVRSVVDPALPRIGVGTAVQAASAARNLPPYPRNPVLPRCYSLGDDQLWGVTRRRKGGDHSLAAFKSIRPRAPTASRFM